MRRRQAAHTTVSTARSQIVFGSSSWKRVITPVTLLPWISLGEFSATFPAVSRLFDVMPGMPNHRKMSSTAEAYSHRR